MQLASTITGYPQEIGFMGEIFLDIWFLCRIFRITENGFVLGVMFILRGCTNIFNISSFFRQSLFYDIYSFFAIRFLVGEYLNNKYLVYSCKLNSKLKYYDNDNFIYFLIYPIVIIFII